MFCDAFTVSDLGTTLPDAVSGLSGIVGNGTIKIRAGEKAKIIIGAWIGDKHVVDLLVSRGRVRIVGSSDGFENVSRVRWNEVHRPFMNGDRATSSRPSPFDLDDLRSVRADLAGDQNRHLVVGGR